MQINEDVEARVREAYGAVIDRDGDRMVRAVRALDSDQGEHALKLALFVCAFIANDVYRDDPTLENLRHLADQVARAESKWVRVAADQVVDVLNLALSGKQPSDALPVPDVLPVAIVTGGHLLAAFRLKDQRWWQYLEEIWEHLLATPDRA